MNSRLRRCTMWQEVEKSTAQRRNPISDVVELNHGAKRAYYYVSGQDQFRQVKFSPMLAKKEIPEKTQERF